MGKNRARREEIERRILGQFDKMNQPDPYLEGLKALNDSVLKWHQGIGGKDIKDNPFYSSMVKPYELAMADRNQGLIGQGALGAKGLKGRDSGYGKDLAMERQFNRQLVAGQLLQQGLDSQLQGAQGNLSGLIGQDYSRMTGANGLLGNLHGAVSSRIHPSFIETLGGQFLGKAAGAGSAALLGMI